MIDVLQEQNMWFTRCDNAHGFTGLYRSTDGLDRVRLFEVDLMPGSRLRLRVELPRFPDQPPARWDRDATNVQVTVDFWLVDGLEIRGWEAETEGTISVERVNDLLEFSFRSETVSLSGRCQLARIDRFSAYAVWPQVSPGGEPSAEQWLAGDG